MRLIIEPGRSARNYWGDLWRYRELLYFLAWRDLAVRYKQSVIGVAWALLRPALTMIVFVLFRRFVNLEAGAVPDPILVLAAVVPWQFFSAALTDASGSLIANTNLIAKIYFPRLIVPGAAVITAFVDFLITLGLLGALMAWYGFSPGWQVAFLPLFAAIAFALSCGLGLLLAALNVQYRDFRYVVPFIVQFGLFISPIAFTTANVPERWRDWFVLNPLVGIIDGFRWALLDGHASLDRQAVMASLVVTAATLAAGIWYFRRVERRFADVI
jgi:lipopolysaccharide transport system permease protein